MPKLTLKSDFKPISDQENAITKLVDGVKKGVDKQVLLGVTGSGKTFTAANVIERTQKPALIISHNKTLAAQLYQEFRDFFPENAVSYFVSYYDYYQPEAYIPSTDTYIEKDADINQLIDKLRLQTTANILTRNDVIVVASVSCIYNIGSPKEYGKFVFEMTEGMSIEREQIISRLIDLQYDRGDFGMNRGSFRIKGDTITIFPAYLDYAVDLELLDHKIKNIRLIDAVTGEPLATPANKSNYFILYPAKHFIADPSNNEKVFETIQKDLEAQMQKFKKAGKDLEAHRLHQKVNYELDMIHEVGYVKGIENYSRYFDGRSPGDAPFTLIDYFNEAYGKDWLLFVDESHITFPQVRGMHAGDLSRKGTLIEYGFRLPAALDNRPLKFDEFMRKVPGFVAISATPSDWELSMAGKDNVVEQLLRPTAIPDPEVDIRPTSSQVRDVIEEVKKRKKVGQRALITTLTKATAEDLAEFMNKEGIDVQYIHSDVATLDRTEILDNLREGKYDALVGINLLREGLDLPEVSLVAILDADKEGFLRSDVTLIQTMGRAARHKEGRVILYADRMTGSMERALAEIKRRREYQIEMNRVLGLTPQSITKPIRERLVNKEDSEIKGLGTNEPTYYSLPNINSDALTPSDKKKLVTTLRREMHLAAADLEFELAAEIRDKIKELEK